jgi:hypothetical protein
LDRVVINGEKQKIMKNWGLLALIGLYIISCIPIEDKINPAVGLVDLQSTYYYQDTIKIKTIFTDNNGMASGKITISRYPVADATGEAWVYADSFDLQGRRIEPEWDIVVPAYKQVGSYLLTLTGFDEGKNPDTLQRVFQIRADTQVPVFHETSIGLSTISDTLFLACRSEVVPIAGGVSDNLKISKIGYAWGNIQPTFLATSTDSLGLAALYRGNIVVPSNAKDGDLLSLQLVAVDTFGNSSTKKYKIKIDCDDQAPTVRVMKTTPSLSANRRVFVPEGGGFSIDRALAWDNRQIASATAYFQPSSSPLAVYASTEVGKSDTVNLADYLPLSFSLPTGAVPGEIYQITLRATDTLGNTSLDETFDVVVLEDAPPIVTVTDTYINGSPVAFSQNSSSPTMIAPKDVLTFSGKVEDQIGLETISFDWFNSAASPVTVKIYKDLQTKLVSLSNLHNTSTFVVPSMVTEGARYTLTIHVWDTKAQETKVVYYFIVKS